MYPSQTKSAISACVFHSARQGSGACWWRICMFQEKSRCSISTVFEDQCIRYDIKAPTNHDSLIYSLAASNGLSTRRVWWKFTCAALELNPRKNSHQKAMNASAAVSGCVQAITASHASYLPSQRVMQHQSSTVKPRQV